VSDAEVTIAQVLLRLNHGGAEVLAARLARRLSNTYRFVFACLEGLGSLGEELRADGFPVHVLGRRPGIDWRCVRRLRAVLRDEGVSVSHAHQYGPFFYSALARLPVGRSPVLFTEHGRAFPDPPKWTHWVTNRLLLQRRDRVVGVGQGVSRVLVEIEGFPGHRVETIYNGVDLPAYGAAAPDRASVRSRIDVGPADFVVVQVARLDPIKDHATALRALEHAVRQRPSVRLVIVGDGPQSESIANLVRARELGPYVRLLGHRSDIPQLLGAADLVLLTSLSEGIPLSLIEAMGAGLPVVATRVGGVPEVVEEGRTGLLAPAGDDEQLAGLILRLAADPELRERLGQAGRERAVEFFSEDRMVASYDQIYHDLATGRRLARPHVGAISDA
jgi:glycosyltransferase involved in cell wall biosynthesis